MTNPKRYKRWIAVFDNHGDMQDDAAVEAMFSFLKYWKPEIRIHGGDCFDFRPLRKKASDEERREATKPDIDAGIEFISRLQPTHFLRGNHDERLWDLLHSDIGQVREAAIDTVKRITTALGDARMYPYDKRKGICRIGQLRVVHGYHTGVTAARQAALTYGAVLMGHIHCIDHYSIPRLKRDIGRACGCLCKLDMDYNRAQAQTLRQEHGFAYGVIDNAGYYHMFQAHPVNKSWVFPTEVREMGGAA